MAERAVVDFQRGIRRWTSKASTGPVILTDNIKNCIINTYCIRLMHLLFV